ncbi:MAG: aminomethyltransferase family protein [Verrucomicrobiales bacterium]|nr:aminomethyltransferase family protein [Verrucomicrobiales bacterium]
MEVLALHNWHADAGAHFEASGGGEWVSSYGDVAAEYRALRRSVGIVDLSSRGRLVLLGSDRQKLLNGQVTNNIKDLATGHGCYAVLVNSKAKMVSDLTVFALESELLLDLEPGRSEGVRERLDKYIIGEDVQIADAAPFYGLLALEGPRAADVLKHLGLGLDGGIPSDVLGIGKQSTSEFGEVYLANHPRIGTVGYDLYVPNDRMASMASALKEAAERVQGRWIGGRALELARVEAGIPRFGVDMNETHLPPEAGIADRAISYTKGCYIGQEVIARIRTYGQVAKSLRGLKLRGCGAGLPESGARLYQGEKEVGQLTSVVESPAVGGPIALGYVRKECHGPGTVLAVGTPAGPAQAEIVPLPFVDRQWAGDLGDSPRA